MFRKKPHIKPLSPLRSSDRRKIADQIIVDFHLNVGTNESAEGDGDGQAAVGTGLGALRSSLLPENSLSARFTTTAGPELKQISGMVYVGAYPDEVQRVLWVRLEERMFPTVYTLWHNPRLVPLLHTPSIVLQKLRGGADLMTPGLAAGPPFHREAKKDSIVAIASLEKPSVPMVVGVCEIEISGLQKIQGEKGRAVRGVHWDGDELWTWGTGEKTGGRAPEHIQGWSHATEPQDAERDLKAEADGEDSQVDGGVPLGDESSRAHNAEEIGKALEGIEVEDRGLSTKEIDEAFRNAFLFAIHHHKTTNKGDANHGLQYPIPQSLVISNLILPYLPIFTPAQAFSLQIKRTSWKSPRKFIKYLEKEKIVKSKDRNGGETVILDVDFEARAILEFVPYKLPKKEAEDGGGRATSAGGKTEDGSVVQQLKMIILYRPKEKLAPLFEASNHSVKSLYFASELRPVITAYTESEELISATNKRLINLNPILANAVFDGQSSIDREVIAKGNVPRDALTDRVVHSCSPFWAILRGDETRDDVKPKAGSPPKIQIVLETRSGNKTVTKVSGVEAFYINSQHLAEELQKTCASSTSVNQFVGSSPKNPVMEILVQGPQKEAVSKALERRAVKRQWIDIIDKTKGKKK
ncbi:MAG: hypothetical protein M1830_000489 [Pleopsidium flavum]|nr:MAG: hypothetical protein M1830_000489 [Pleopsidium flavum]